MITVTRGVVDGFHEGEAVCGLTPEQEERLVALGVAEWSDERACDDAPEPTCLPDGGEPAEDGGRESAADDDEVPVLTPEVPE